MTDFKKIKFDLVEGIGCIGTRENKKGKAVTLEEVIKIISNPQVIKITLTRKSMKEVFEAQRRGEKW